MQDSFCISEGNVAFSILLSQTQLLADGDVTMCAICTHTICMTMGAILTYLLTPWSRVLLEKLTGFQLVKKFPAFYGTRKFITAFTNAHHLSLS